jgi:predicted  nucleic acid-binding Zn-ribbon protein
MTIDEALESASGWQAGPSLKLLASEITRLRAELAEAKAQHTLNAETVCMMNAEQEGSEKYIEKVELELAAERARADRLQSEVAETEDERQESLGLQEELGTCQATLQSTSLELAGCQRRAAEAEARADRLDEPAAITERRDRVWNRCARLEAELADANKGFALLQAELAAEKARAERLAEVIEAQVCGRIRIYGGPDRCWVQNPDPNGCALGPFATPLEAAEAALDAEKQEPNP